MRNLIVLFAIGLMGAGPLAPFPTGGVVHSSVQGTTGPTGATGPQGPAGAGSMADGGNIQGGLSVQGLLTADGGINLGPGTSICMDGPTCSDQLTILGGFVRSINDFLASGVLAQGNGFSTNSGGHYSDNGYTLPPVQWLNVDAGSSTASHWEMGACTASSNACPSQTLHFSSTPYCVCSDDASTLGACSVTGVTAIAVVPKTFGATDVATWMCFGAN